MRRPRFPDEADSIGSGDHSRRKSPSPKMPIWIVRPAREWDPAVSWCSVAHAERSAIRRAASLCGVAWMALFGLLLREVPGVVAPRRLKDLLLSLIVAVI